MAPTMRALHISWNIGIEATIPLLRALHTSWNVGIEQVFIPHIIKRALHASWSITKQSTGPNDPVEWLLFYRNLLTLLHIIRGK